MEELVETWGSLSRPWQAFAAMFCAALLLGVFTGLVHTHLTLALLGAVVWASAVGVVVHLRDRLQDSSEA